MNKNNYFYILSEYNTNILSTLREMESRYKNIVVSLSNDEVEDANYQAKRLIRDTKNSISNNIEKSNYISINLRKLRNEVTDEQKAVLDKIDEVNKELVNQIEKFNFEYVEDFEIFYNKLKFFREVVRETHLGGYSFRNFLNRLTEDSYSTMKDYFDNIDVDDVLKGLDSVSRILKRY